MSAEVISQEAEHHHNDKALDKGSDVACYPGVGELNEY